jgi:hypothetical protein
VNGTAVFGMMQQKVAKKKKNIPALHIKRNITVLPLITVISILKQKHVKNSQPVKIFHLRLMLIVGTLSQVVIIINRWINVQRTLVQS